MQPIPLHWSTDNRTSCEWHWIKWSEIKLTFEGVCTSQFPLCVFSLSLFSDWLTVLTAFVCESCSFPPFFGFAFFLNFTKLLINRILPKVKPYTHIHSQTRTLAHTLKQCDPKSNVKIRIFSAVCSYRYSPSFRTLFSLYLKCWIRNHSMRNRICYSFIMNKFCKQQKTHTEEMKRNIVSIISTRKYQSYTLSHSSFYVLETNIDDDDDDDDDNNNWWATRKFKYCVEM